MITTHITFRFDPVHRPPPYHRPTRRQVIAAAASRSSSTVASARPCVAKEGRKSNHSATASHSSTPTIPSNLSVPAPTPTPPPLPPACARARCLSLPSRSVAFVGGQILLANSRVRSEIETEERSLHSFSLPPSFALEIRSSFPPFSHSEVTRRVQNSAPRSASPSLPIITAPKLPIKTMNVTL